MLGKWVTTGSTPIPVPRGIPIGARSLREVRIAALPRYPSVVTTVVERAMSPLLQHLTPRHARGSSRLGTALFRSVRTRPCHARKV